MKTEQTTLVKPESMTATNPLIQYQYLSGGIVPAWPPLVPEDAEFVPLAKMRTPDHALEIRRTFSVAIRQAAYNRMMFYVLNAPGEVSGFGKVTRRGNSFIVEDVIILDQHNTEVSSDITWQTLNKFMQVMKRRGESTEGWDLWWHSHNNFGVGFSQTDVETIEELRSGRFTLSIVTNKMFDFACRVDFYNPIRYGLGHLPVKILPEFDEQRAQELQADMDAMAKHGKSGRKK